MEPILDFIKQTEKSHFRTVHDTGANSNALFVWNLVRQHAGLSPLQISDLPGFCETHGMYHTIRIEYGCKNSLKRKVWARIHTS